MPKYLCTVKATIYITREVCDTIEIDAPDEIQAGEDAITAAAMMDEKTWLQHPEIDFIEDQDFEFDIEDIEEKMTNSKEKENKIDFLGKYHPKSLYDDEKIKKIIHQEEKKKNKNNQGHFGEGYSWDLRTELLLNRKKQLEEDNMKNKKEEKIIYQNDLKKSILSNFPKSIISKILKNIKQIFS